VRPKLIHSPLVAPLAALVTLVVFNVVFTPGFAHVEFRDGRLFGSAIDIVQNGAPVMLLAVGMTLVIATGGIDLSVGSIMALSAAIAALLITRGGQPPWLAALIALSAALAGGIWNGLLVTRLGLQPIVATLVSLVAGRGLAQVLSADQKIRFENPAFEVLANGAALGLPVPLYLVAAIAIIVLLLLRFTIFGRAIEAIGVNPRAARLCGIRVDGTRTLAYGISGVCAGLAGLIAAADIKEADVANCGLYFELDAILAVVLGGTALTGGRPRLVGALLGAAFMQTLAITLQMRGVVTEYTLLIKAVVALTVCILQSERTADWFRRVLRAEPA
jgi:ribose/xylose/arabinose/galactoside ABC-type transport system permease subunit